MGRGKRVLKAMAFLVLLGAAAFVIYEAFKVREINVIGADRYAADTVAALSGIEYESSVFLLDKQAVMDALATEPFIKPKAVDIEYPDKVILTIEERQPAACIEKDGALLIIDDECWLLEAQPAPQDMALPYIYGVQTDVVQVGQRLMTTDVFKLDVLSSVLMALRGHGMTANSIDVTVAADIVIVLPQGITAELGDDTELGAKLKLIAVSIEQLSAMGKSGGILDVSTVKNAYYREN